eukprot:UN00663
MRSFIHFLIFSSRTEKILILKDFFGSLRCFLHSFHSITVASGRYVFREGLLRPPLGHPQRGPRPSPRTPQPSLQTPRPFAPFVPKSRSVSKKFFENEHFFLFSP